MRGSEVAIVMNDAASNQNTERVGLKITIRSSRTEVEMDGRW